MAANNACHECGAPLPENAPEGLCPKCLMRVAMGESHAGATLNDSGRIDGPGTAIGRYKLLELIGEGGMGLVYLAEQKEPVRRKVALKIIKPGMDSKQVIARFEAERQALALLDHPNIAHVFDAGTTDTGRPYFVMEYVRGMSITRYCDEHRLDVEQRLRLFQEACEGVHHAHQKGVIHRDIKPSNILISMHGDRAVPKIIDFGIAKAAASTLTEKTMFTFQGQLLGTPEYMSPEQVDFATQDIDTRSDIYSLGVVLYELLAGVLPFDRESLHKSGLAELQRTLRELEPASPSIRLANLGQQAKAIADSRMTQVVPLARRLHRELEWIPLKAMRKDRCRRYKSASDMADDIQSYLNGNPLLAGPETAMYRVQKFVHKHAGFVTTVALVSLAVVVGLVVSIAMGRRAEQARQQEAAARIEAEQARDKETALRKQLEEALSRAEKAEGKAEERAEAYRRAMYTNNLAMAKEAIDKGDFSRAQKLLNACEPDLRGWEWQHLNYVSADPCIRTLRGHSDDVNWLALSPDGRQIASAGGDETVKIWDMATGSEVRTLRGHSASLEAVAFSPDGKRIASGADDGVIKIWDAASGAELKTLRGHRGWIGSIAFSPDGRYMASSGRDAIVRVWDATEGVEVMMLRGHARRLWEVAYSPNGKFIVSGSNDGTIKMWDAQTGAEIRTLAGHDEAVFSIAVSPDGSRIASGGEGTAIRIWNANNGAEEITIRGHTRGTYSVAFSPDGKRIAAAACHDAVIKVWDAGTGYELTTLRGHHASGVSSIVFSLNGKRIISGGWDGMIKVWDPAIGRKVFRRYRGTGIRQLAFSPDSTRIAACTTWGRIVLIDILNGIDILTLRGHYDHWGTDDVAFSPDGSRFASGGDDGRVYVWNALTGALERTLTGHTGTIRSVAFSADGRRIASGSWDDTIKVWDAATGALERTLTGHKDGVRSVTFSPDGSRIISGGHDGTVRIWDALSGTELLILQGHEWHVWDVSVSPDSKRIASCSGDETIRVWNAATGMELMTLHGHESEVRTVAFSPDGRRIVSGDDKGKIKIWDADTGMELIDLYGNATDGRIESAVFSPDGKSICIGSGGEGGITVWESVEPTAGYEARRIANSANSLVDELYEKHDFYYNVISRLRDDDTIVEPVRSRALQIASDRLWEDARKLYSQSWQLAKSPDHNDVTYREALAKLKKAVSLDPTNYRYVAHLAVAQLRVGAYEESLATRALVRKMRDDAGIGFVSPCGDGYTAMALHQLGRYKQANAALKQARSRYGEGWLSRRYGLSFLDRVFEIEKFFAGEDRTVLAILEYMEENKLDEASILIEETRQSKNADYIDRMEGAVKLLEALRNLK